jgi:hypothetical protein
MSNFVTLVRSIAAAAFMLAVGGEHATAGAQRGLQPAGEDLVISVAADCYSIGERVAAQRGGTLARASAAKRGGQTVCIIVVLVPGKDGQRPRRTEVVVPAN